MAQRTTGIRKASSGGVVSRAPKELTADAKVALEKKLLEIEGELARSEGAHLAACVKLGEEFQEIKAKHKKAGVAFCCQKLGRKKTWVYSYIKIAKRFDRAQLESASIKAKGRIERAHLVHLASKKGMTKEDCARWLDRIVDLEVSPSQLRSELYPKKSVASVDVGDAADTTSDDVTAGKVVAAQSSAPSNGRVDLEPEIRGGTVERFNELGRVFAAFKDKEIGLVGGLIDSLEAASDLEHSHELDAALSDLHGSVDALWSTLSAVRRRIESVRRRCSLQASSSSPTANLTQAMLSVVEMGDRTFDSGSELAMTSDDFSLEEHKPKLLVVSAGQT